MTINTVEPWLILRCVYGSVFIYAMPAGGNVKNWVRETLENILNDTVQFQTDNLGKPRLKQGLGFANWSHSRNEAVLAYSKDCEVGIDLEFYRKKDFKKIAQRFFNKNEYPQNAEEFYRLWTRKEAHYKCIGGNFFETLKNDLRNNSNGKTLLWNFKGPYRESHELALAAIRG